MTSNNSGENLCTRRQWVKQFVLGSAVVCGAGATWRGRLLADISPTSNPMDILALHIATDFPDLLGGGTPSIQIQISGFPEIIMVTLTSQGMYVLNSKCTHMGCTVYPWNASDNILCPCHGSNYNIDGTIIREAVPGSGQPGLNSYQFNWDGFDLLQILVPGLDLTVNKVGVEKITAGTTRLRLDFPGRALTTYQVFYTPDLISEAQPVQFSLTANGPVDQDSIDIGLNNTPTSVWVDDSGTEGFYSIALVVTQISS